MNNPFFTVDQQSINPKRLKQALLNGGFKPAKKDEKWYSLIRKLPKGLQEALLLELDLGNYVNSIQYANWPQQGNIFVSLGMPFKFDFTNNNYGVEKMVFGDPHYWSQDIRQTVDGVDYLIIC